MDHVRQAQTQLLTYPLNRPRRQFVPALRESADLFRGYVDRTSLVNRRVQLEPGSHSRSCRQRFPATAKAARTSWPGCVDNVVADFGMRHVRSAIKFPIQNNSASDARANRYINQARLSFSGSPTRFA